MLCCGFAERVVNLLLGTVIAVVGFGAPHSAYATSRALLIGVSNYPDQRMRLKGPVNDVSLLYSVLIRRGFDPANIRVLADSIGQDGLDSIAVAGLPTRHAIVEAFSALGAEAESGDEIFISMSGHGTQQPARDSSNEPDGLDELFLPLDVGRWNASIGSIDNAIIDDEIGQFLNGIRVKGASVWLVMDSCNSGTGTRAALKLDLRVRSVTPESLGVPSVRPRSVIPSEPPSQPADIRSDEGIVAFFAAQSDESAFELALPAGEPTALVHGLLTYYVAQGLARDDGWSYLELAQNVRAGYDKVGGSRSQLSTPLFEGDLSTSVLGGLVGNGGRWPARRLDADRARIDAGQLHGLSVGAEVLLRDASGKLVGRASVIALGIAQSDVSRSVSGGAVLPNQMVAEVATIAAPDPFLVYVPPTVPASLRSALRIVGDRHAADAGIVFDTQASSAMLDLQVARDAVWLVPHGDEVTDVIAAGGAGIPLTLPAVQLASQLDDSLRSRAAAYRLAQLSEIFVATPTAQALRVDLSLLRSKREPTRADPHPACAPLDQAMAAVAKSIGREDVPQMQHCDTLFVTLRNRGNDPLDLGIFYVDSLGTLVPLPNLSALRLDAETPPLVLPLTVTTWDQTADKPAATGIERLVVVGLKRVDETDGSYVTDFSNALGLSPGAAQFSDSGHPFLGLLAGNQEAAPTRGAPKGDPRKDAFITTVHWHTMPF